MPEGNRDEVDTFYRPAFSVFRHIGQLCLGRFACIHPGALLAIVDCCAARMPDI
jgi:hypothetical protein